MGRAFEFRKARKMKRWSAMAKRFTRIGKDIVMAVKDGGPSPESNSKLRAIIQNAKAANMPKENIERAINKSELNKDINYNSIIYEGFGPEKIAVIVEALTENRNRTASNVRTIFQKNGGNLGSSGVASHQFRQVGVIRIEKNKITDDNILELAINSGAEDCYSNDLYHEIITLKENFYKVKVEIEKKIQEFSTSGIEWIPINKISLNQEKTKSVLNLLELLEDDDDVQYVYANLEIENTDLMKDLKK